MVRNSLKKCRKDDAIVDISGRYNHPEDKVMPITGGMARIGELLFTLPLHVIATLRICRTLLRLVSSAFFILGVKGFFPCKIRSSLTSWSSSSLYCCAAHRTNFFLYFRLFAFALIWVESMKRTDGSTHPASTPCVRTR